ncbi:MAG: CAP domain-containing protein [Oscillospiraceae bacterium]|nr:CAP domain-containing protein [Oscillospiraceae bacterium]
MRMYHKTVSLKGSNVSDAVGKTGFARVFAVILLVTITIMALNPYLYVSGAEAAEAEVERAVGADEAAEAEGGAEDAAGAEATGAAGAEAVTEAAEAAEAEGAAGAANVEAAATAAVPTSSMVLVDGSRIRVDAYNIADYNYFRLRGLAAAVDCAVWYDEDADTVNIDTTGSYVEPEGVDEDASESGKDVGEGSGEGSGEGDGAGGGEGEGADSGESDGENSGGEGGSEGSREGDSAGNGNGDAADSIKAVPTTSIILFDGKAADLEVYNINDYNYFKLRDFLKAVNIGVWYDESTDTINIETDIGYDPNYTGKRNFSETQVPLGPVDVDTGTDGEEGADDEEAGEDDVPGVSGIPDDIDGLELMVWEYRLKIVELVNAERAFVGLDPLGTADELFEIAQFKSDDMARSNYFAHESPTYGDLEALFDYFHLDFYFIGENLGKGHTTPEHVMHDWMESPGHRMNVLDEDFEFIGVGLSIDNEGFYLWTQTFYAGPW